MDDHAVVREGLKHVFAKEWPGAEFGEAQNAQEALQLARQQAWDAVMLDLNMPGRSGLDLLLDLKQEHPRLPVLVLTIHPEEQYAVRALKAGAAGYLTKGCPREELIKALHKVLEGGRYVSPTLAERLAFALAGDSTGARHELLSDREYQVLVGIASGKTVTEIAGELSLSVKTVSSYRTRLLTKMGMRTNSELTRYAIRNQLVDDSNQTL